MELELHGRLALRQAIADEHRVLLVRHQHPLLDARALPFVLPDWQSGFQPEGREPSGDLGVEPSRRALLPTERAWLAAFNADSLREVIEHNDPADRIRQRGDQQPVIPPRVDAGNGAGSVATQSVRLEPLGFHQGARAVVLATLELQRSRDSIEESSHIEPSTAHEPLAP